MKHVKMFSLACVLLALFVASAFADQTVVELKTCNVSSDQANRNTTVLSNAIRPNVIIQLPAGNFTIDPISINGIENLTIIGVEDPTTHAIKTRLRFIEGTTGLSLSNVPNMHIENLEIQGNSNSNLVVLSNAGDLSVNNLKLTASTTDAFADCLQPNLAWLVPVISFVLN